MSETPSITLARFHYTDSRTDRDFVSHAEADEEFDRLVSAIKAEAVREAAGQLKTRLSDGNGEACNAHEAVSTLDEHADQIENGDTDD